MHRSTVKIINFWFSWHWLSVSFLIVKRIWTNGDKTYLRYYMWLVRPSFPVTLSPYPGSVGWLENIKWSNRCYLATHVARNTIRQTSVEPDRRSYMARNKVSFVPQNIHDFIYVLNDARLVGKIHKTFFFYFRNHASTWLQLLKANRGFHGAVGSYSKPVTIPKWVFGTNSGDRQSHENWKWNNAIVSFQHIYCMHQSIKHLPLQT